MAAEAQQKEWEWIWEFFLKNCTKDRMIRELLDCVPFPDENLKLRRLLLLRMLSLQVSEGIVNEETLELLRGHGVLCRFLEARKEGRPSHSTDPAFPTLSKASKDKKNNGDNHHSDASGLPPDSSQNPSKRTLPSYMEHRSNADSPKSKSEPAVGIRDWMKGRALPRSSGAQGGANEETEPSQGNGRDSSAVGARPLKQWELEQAVMVELTVKHLRNIRADAGNRALFEQAAAKYWGDSVNDAETWDDEADREEMVKARKRIRSELRSTEMNVGLMEKVLKKYPKDRVESVLKPHLDSEWSIVGQTFLERVSSDIVNGKYNPVNGRSPWQSKAAGVFSEKADYGRESGCRAQTIEKPGVRASRGKFSRSREKSQKKFTIWDLDDGEGEGDGRAGNSSGMGKDDGKAPVSPSRRKKLEIDVRARRLGLTIEEGIARVLEFEEPGGQPSCDEKHVTEGDARIRIEEISEGRPDLSNPVPAAATERHDVDHNGSSPTHSGKLDTGILSPSDAVCAPIAEEPDPAEVEDQFFEPDHSTHVDGGDAEMRSDVEIVDKENIVPPAPRESLDPNQNPACFNPPPWVTGSAATLDTSEEAAALIRKKRKSGINADKENAATPNSAHVDEVEVGENCTIEELDTTKARRNSQSEQTNDAAATDPLSNVQPSSRPTSNLFERNASAHTKRWNEDEIESEPDSPSAPKRGRLSGNVIERRITPLVGVTPSSPSESSLNMGRQNRRKRRRWSDREVSKLKEEVEKCGKGRWKYILEHNPEEFEGRTEVDLKDKWRNLERYEGMA